MSIPPKRPSLYYNTRIRFNATCLSRDDICSLTEEAAKISGIPYVMDTYRLQAMEIMNGNGAV